MNLVLIGSMRFASGTDATVATAGSAYNLKASALDVAEKGDGSC